VFTQSFLYYQKSSGQDCEGSVGINDNVSIQNPPANTPGPPNGQIMPPNTLLIKACSPASFYAKFTTGSTPRTYSESYDWSIELYHAQGTYVYAQENVIQNASSDACLWSFSPGILPSFKWSYNYDGNIFGKLKVTVHVSDGDTKTDERFIAVSPFAFFNNLTYNVTTTINACATPNFTNIKITGSPIVTVNTNGLGMRINSTFQVQKGSRLIINK